jgi:two-component system, NarL family, sensor kinase
MPNDSKEVIVMLIGGSILFLVLVSILIFVVLFYQKKKFLHVRQLFQIDKLHTETLFQSQIEIQEETLKNISQEIHDNIGQVLSLIKLNLNSLSEPQNPADKEKLENSIDLLSKSIKDLRDVARSINTDYVLQIGLNNAIRQQLSLLEKTGVFQTKMNEFGEARSLGQRNELIVFRIVQELLNNIVKHANASIIEIKAFYDIDKLKLMVIDNGRGFDIAAVKISDNTTKGLGLSNMLNRINLINGRLDIYSEPGKGTTISIELPC